MSTAQAPSVPSQDSLTHAEAPSPSDVLIGAGGDPLALGVSVFAIGARTLGMLFVGVFPAGAAGVAVPIAIFTTGVPLLLTAVGALSAGSRFSGIFGTVAGLFMSFGFLVVGLAHNGTRSGGDGPPPRWPIS